jgi:hypothetical protein
MTLSLEPNWTPLEIDTPREPLLAHDGWLPSPTEDVRLEDEEEAGDDIDDEDFDDDFDDDFEQELEAEWEELDRDLMEDDLNLGSDDDEEVDVDDEEAEDIDPDEAFGDE